MNIEQTISLYLDGELTSEQEAEFHHLLSVSPEARTLFRQHMALQTIARQEETLLTPEDGLRSSLFARLQSEGLSADGIPSGVIPDPDLTAAPAPEPTARPSTEQVRRRPSGESLGPAAMRGPVANEQSEERKRRRLIPFLIPMLLVAVAGSILWLDRGDNVLGSGEETIASAVETDDSRAPEAAAQSLTDADVPPPTPVDPQNAVDQSAEAQPTEPIILSTAVSRERETRARSRNGRGGGTVASNRSASSVSNSTETERSEEIADLGHSIPPSNNLGGTSPRDLDLASSTVNTTLGEGAAAASRSDLDDMFVLRRDTPDAPAGLTSTVDGMGSRASIESQYITPTNIPEPQFAASAPRSQSTQDLPVVVRLTDDQGNPRTPLYEDSEELLAILRSQGIFIGHDGTFSFGPVPILDSADVDMKAMRVLGGNGNGSAIVFRTSAESAPSVVVESDGEGFVNEPSEMIAAKRAERSNALDPVDPVIGRASFISIEGGLNTGLASSERTITWVQDDPVRQTSQVRGEFILKGGLQEGSLRLFAVGGISPFDERRVTYNTASMAPVPPVTEYTITTEAELWGGIGSRYIIRVNDRIATGVEGIVGAGTERFHAGISLPISVSMQKNLIIEILPNVRYRNAHSPMKPTTGTSPFDEETLRGPAHSDELDFGTNIGLILLLR